MKTEDTKLEDSFGGSLLKTSPRICGSHSSKAELDRDTADSHDHKVSEMQENTVSGSSSIDLQSDLPFDNDLQCKICYRYFRSMHTLAQHVRFHAVKSYKCATCSKVFSIKASYKQHICSHASVKTYDCGICDATFMDQGSWKRHKERHFGVRNHSCDICGMAFYEKYSLRVHQTSHFYSSMKSEKDLNSGFTCHICQKYFKTKKDMKNHLVAHSTKKYTCEFCNKRFSLKYSYVRHRRIHTGERPYKCGICDLAFSDGSAWSKHVKMHSGIKPYNCDTCNKAFFDKSSCNTHMKSCRKAKNRSRRSDNTKFELCAKVTRRSEKAGSKETDAEKVGYEISDSESQIGTEDVSFIIGNEDKEFDQNELIDSGFDPGFLNENEKASVTKKSPTNDPIFTAVVENVKQDKKFQKDFVERHMPDKPFDSECEFLSSNFPEGTDMLDNDNFAFTENEVDENETEDQSDSNDIFPKSNTSPISCVNQSTPQKRETRGRKRGRRPLKYVPESPAKCQRCSKTFKSDNSLKQHQNVHCMLKKLYKCRYCGKQLSSKSALARHERIHTGERPYECYICQKTFVDKSGCIRHIRHHLSTTSKLSIIKPLQNSGIGKNERDIVSYTEQEKDMMEPEVPSFDQRKPQTSMIEDIEKELVKKDLNFHYKNDSFDDVKSLENSFEIGAQGDSLKASEVNTIAAVKGDEQSYVVDDSWSDNLTVDSGCRPESTVRLFDKPDETLSLKLDQTDNEPDVQTNLNSGASLYRCGFCGLLFDSEAGCGMHIGQECLSYRNSVSNVVENKPITSEAETYPNESLGLETKSTSSVISNANAPSLPVQTNNLVPGTTLLESIGRPASVTSQFERHLTTSDKPGFINLGSLQQSSQTKSNTVSSTPAPSNVRFLVTDQHSLLARVRLQPNAMSIISSGNISKSTQSNAAVSLLNTQPISKPTQSNAAVSLLNTQPVKESPANCARLCLLPPSQVNTTVSDSSSLLPVTPGSQAASCTSLQTVATPEQMTFLIRPPGSGGKPKSMGGKPKSMGGKPKSASALQNKCLVCGKTFKNKYILKHHSETHQDRKFSCDYCTKKFHHKYGYERHVRIHTGEKPYSCINCKSAFSDKSHLLKHVRQCAPKTN